MVRRRRLVPERIGRLDNDEGRTGDQIMSLQDPIDGGFGDKVTLRVGEPDRQLPRREFRFLQGKLDDLLANAVRDTVPHPAGTAGAVFEAGQAERLTVVFGMPSLSRVRRTGRRDCSTKRMIARFRKQRLHLVARGLARGITGEAFLTSLRKFLRSAVIQALGDALFAAQPFKDNADLLFR